MTGLLLLTVAGLLAVAWWRLLKGKEQARWAASVACREHGLLLMDDTVMLDAVQLTGGHDSHAYGLRYRFEFAQKGVLRKGGSVLIAPGRRPTVVIRTRNGELIQQV